MRILFMGTPDFAVASLRRLVEDGHEICGVFTQPDKPKNRGHKVAFSPVKEYALSRELPVYQPVKLRDGSALTLVQELAPELIVVAAYGKILPEDILNVPPYGSINVHASLLPRYRGAAPVNRAIMGGESVTGITIMYMAKELDAGDMLLQSQTAIDPEETAAALMARLAHIGAQALHDALCALQKGTAVRTPQQHHEATYAPMLSREESPIDWTRPAQAIRNQVRGLIPWPCACTVLGGQTVKVYQTAPGEATDAAPGTVLSGGKRGIEISCGDGMSLFITELQPEGGKRMTADAYLAGHSIETRHA
ncbi:MAG: methionyl-tRNA formyltransferase [Oscillospiraceae bacterium]|nr:methionyl-tRNA formyltransferase [Oscillospiraceae bacterium]